MLVLDESGTLLAKLEPVSYFGEIAALKGDAGRYGATVTADAFCELLSISSQEFLRIVRYVCGRVCGHVCTHVGRHVGRHVCRHVCGVVVDSIARAPSHRVVRRDRGTNLIWCRY